jgi:acetate kinase
VRVLVLNSGSSSVKYQVVDTDAGEPLVVGQVERIGAGGAILTQLRISDRKRIKESGTVGDHRDAVRAILDLVKDPERGALTSPEELEAVGHRVVHGGEAFTRSVSIDEAVVEGIRDSMELAPLHNPHSLSGILAARERLPAIPHVAVFDTAFHAGLGPVQYHYAIPYAFYVRHRIRRYGFHGTSHQHVLDRSAALLGLGESELRLVSLHLGNGASACAIREGRSFDTSMGLTPLEGLVMGTRSGDLDPAVILNLMAHEELSVAEATALLNKQSGLRGLSGISGDMRDLLREERDGRARARLALDVYTYRIRKYIGAYAAALGGLDAVAFTGGVGENAAGIRSRVLENLGFLGVAVDEARNRALTGGVEGTFHEGPVALLVIPNGEELMIARETARVVRRGDSSSTQRFRNL